MSDLGAVGRGRHLIAAAVLAAFVLRAAVGWAVNVESGIQRGFDFYGFMADHVLSGRGLVWSFYEDLGEKWANRAPLYPLVVAAVRLIAGTGSALPVILVQAAIGAVACLVPAALARRWAGERAAWIAAWIAALWPYSVVLDTALVEHVVYAPLVGLSLLTGLRSAESSPGVRSLVAGAVAGLATLARLTFGATAAFVAAACLVRDGRWRRTALFAAGAAVVLGPWIVRNHEVTGAWVLGTDSGRALWASNAPGTFLRYPAESIDESERVMLRSLTDEEWRELRAQNSDEVAQDRLFRGRAIDEIGARPAGAAWGCVRKAAVLWSPVMNPGPVALSKLALFALSSVALLGASAAAAVRVPRMRADLPLVLATALSFTLVAAVFWGQSRYFAPLHGIAIAAAGAWIAARSAERPGALS